MLFSPMVGRGGVTGPLDKRQGIVARRHIVTAALPVTGLPAVTSSSNSDAVRTLDGGPELSTFARSFAQRAPRLAWFLGAGASAQSFVPTADQLVDVLLRQVYCTERGVSIDSIDLGDPHERRRLHHIYSGQLGLPEDHDPRFYSEVFERAYPTSGDRSAFIESQVRDALPNYGHHVLAALVATNSLRLVATTNFDPLLERAINPVLDTDLFDGRQLEVADLDNPSRAVRALAGERWPLVVKVHGDYRSDHLKNISVELQQQDADLRKTIAGALGRFGLVVVGYSGRDESVMKMLRDALALPSPYPAGLFWVKRPQDELATSVTDLLSDAGSVGVDVSVVTASSFVDFATRLEHAVSMPAHVRQWLSARSPAWTRRPEPAPVGPTGTAPILRLNALPLEQLPREGRTLEWLGGHVPLSRLREAVRGPDRDALAGIVGGAPVAFGRDSTLRMALADVGVGVTDGVRPLDMGTDDSEEVDTQALGLVTDALVIGLAKQRGLGPVLRQHRPHLLRVLRPEDTTLDRLRRACAGQLRGVIQHPGSGLRLPWAEAISVNLERRRGQWWLILNPEIWTRPRPLARDGAPPPTTGDLEALDEQRGEFIRERTARRYNRQTGEILDAWRDILTGGQRTEIRTFDLGSDEGIDAVSVLDGSAATSLPLLTRQG